MSADGHAGTPRLVSVWDPDRRTAVLALESTGDGLLYRVRSVQDVADLLGRCPDAPSLLDAVDALGVDGSMAWRLDELGNPPSTSMPHLLAPVRPAEVWAAGVTYRRSQAARRAESEVGDVYDRVYKAERPELFLKATAPRIVGPGGRLGVRSDAAWAVPEPELAVVLTANGRFAGYTLGDDVTCRDIEAANPLYLPQAKIFNGCLSLGPAVVPAEAVDDPYAVDLTLTIERCGQVLFEDQITTGRLERTLEELVSFLRRDNALPPGAVLLTGTGIVPPEDIALAAGDVVTITADIIGSLTNLCAPAAEIDAPRGWLGDGVAA